MRRGLWCIVGLISACGQMPVVPPPPAPPAAATKVGPLAGLTTEQTLRFQKGDGLFDLTLRPGDGLGPLYTKAACSQCHFNDARGPGVVQKMVLVEPDGLTTMADQSKLAFGHTVHPLTTAGATTAILPPEGDDSLKISLRLGPSVLGRGYMEAIADADIRAEADAQAHRTDGVHGVVNEVIYQSLPNDDTRVHRYQKGDRVIGRFGLKARIATLDDFTADALQGDMGITSPLRPTEFKNPDGLTDDLKPGIDLTMESVNARSDYMRLLAIPERGPLDEAGRAAFAAAACNSCHKADYTTRTDYPVDQLAGVAAPIYTDLLLHDLGDALSDSMVGDDGQATSRQWRTTPLIGLRFNRTLMHDGRALSVEAAISAHQGNGSEANASVAAFHALSEAERAALLTFVNAL